MIRPAAKWLTAASVVAVCAGLCMPTEAGVIPAVYNFIFGPSYPAMYGPPGGYSVGYGRMGGCAPCGAPAFRGACAPCGIGGGCETGACAPAGVSFGAPVTFGAGYGACSTGGCAQYGPISCAPCEVGGTAASAAPAAPTPPSATTAPADGWRPGAESPMPRTYADPSNDEAPFNSSSAPPATTAPATPRTVPDPGFVPANRKPADPADVDAFRVPETRPTPVTPREKTPAIEDDKDASHGPILNLDEKVAWRPAVERERLPVKPHYANARLVRTPTYPKTDWVPVAGESKLAKN